jgi:hypothetical protein
MYEDELIQEDASIENHDNHSFSYPITFPIREKYISVKEDAIMENHESLVCHSPPIPWEDVMEHEEETVDKNIFTFFHLLLSLLDVKKIF